MTSQTPLKRIDAMMKILLTLTLVIVTSISYAVDIELDTYYGTSKNLDGEEINCYVKVRKLYPNGDILVKTTFDSYFSWGYQLSKKGKNDYYYNDTEGNDDGVIIDLEIDEDGKVIRYNKALLTDTFFSYVVVNKWCEIDQ